MRPRHRFSFLLGVIATLVQAGLGHAPATAAIAPATPTSRDLSSFDPGVHTLNLGEGASVEPGLYFVRLVHGANERVASVTVLE